MFELLAALVDKSLVQAVPQAADAARYRMLETIREYGTERLDRSRRGWRGRGQAHACLLLRGSPRRPSHTSGAPTQLPWIAQARAPSADNLIAALRFS